MLVPGQVYRSTYTVEDLDAPPEAVTLVITQPDGTATDPPPDVGEPTVSGRNYTYAYEYTLPSAGLFGFTWTTTGPGTSRPTGWVNVRDFVSVLSLDDARDFLGAETATPDDALLEAMDAATRLAETVAGILVVRQFTDTIPGVAAERLAAPHGPFPAADSVTSVASQRPGGPSWAAADLVLDQAAGLVYRADGLWFTGGPWTAVYTGGPAGGVVTGLDVQGVKEILWDLWSTQRGLSIDTDVPDLEQAAAFESAMAGGGLAGYRIPPRALVYLKPIPARVTGFA